MIRVTVVTPTYQRRAFIPTLIEIYRQQDFPKDQMEWLILDDGRDSVADLFQEAAQTLPNIRYHHLREKMRIGAKRNWLNQQARGDILVAMDDDDYYPPQRISSVVQAFDAQPTIDLAGSSEMNIYELHSKRIFTVGPYGPRHATNGTMAWRARYARTHRYDETVTKGEESSFLESYRHPMIQLDPKKTILVIAHTDNTVDKSALHDPRQAMKPRRSTSTLSDWVTHPSLRAFYENSG